MKAMQTMIRPGITPTLNPAFMGYLYINFYLVIE